MFFWTPKWSGLRREDNQYCPCPSHPWRSFVLNGPRTWEANHAASKAWHELPQDPVGDVQEENRRSGAIMEEYWADRERWAEKTGR